MRAVFCGVVIKLAGSSALGGICPKVKFDGATAPLVFFLLPFPGIAICDCNCNCCHNLGLDAGIVTIVTIGLG